MLAAAHAAGEAAFAVEATSASTTVARHSVGGARLRLEVVGRLLSDMVLAPLAHLRADAGAPDLQIRVWGGRESNADWLPRALLHHAELLRFRGFLCAGDLFCIVDRSAGEEVPEFVSLFDRSRGSGLHWSRDPEWGRYHLKKTPLHDILRWAHAPAGRYLVHAAAVGRPEGGVLIVGASGAGKTLTALSCLGSSLRYAGDDVCLVRCDPATPTVFSLYNSAAVNHADLPGVVELAALQENADRPEEKPLLLLHPTWKDSLITEFPLRAIVLPRVTTAAAPRLRPATPGEVLLGLGPTSVLQYRGAGAQHLAGLADLVRAVPGYWLDLGVDRGAIPGILGGLL